MNRSAVLWLALGLALVPVRALAWEPFRSQNGDVDRGNTLLNKGEAKEALEAYDAAARSLPNDPGVQLNRGLALMAQGKLGPAREAFRNASQGAAPAQVRGEALYDMGLAFMREADGSQKGGQLEEAQKSLREAVDAFKGSLRARPGNRDAAWNLELARKRLVEVEKQKKEEEQKKDQEKKDQQDQDQQNQDQDQQNQDQEKKDQQNQDQQNQDQQDQQNQDQQDQQDQDQQKSGEKKDGQPKPDEGKEGEQKQPAEGEQKEPKPQPQKPQDAREQPAEPTRGTPEERMPEPMRRALEALESGEENLEKHRAQMRARQRPRRIEKDW